MQNDSVELLVERHRFRHIVGQEGVFSVRGITGMSSSFPKEIAMKNRATINRDVAERFAFYPGDVRLEMARLRVLIFVLAAGDELIGELEEISKCGEQAYLISVCKSGSD